VSLFLASDEPDSYTPAGAKTISNLNLFHGSARIAYDPKPRGFGWEAYMRDIKERLSLFWIFALLNYLYADVVALFYIVDSPNLAAAPHLPIAMIVASRLLPFRANRLANIIAGALLTLINGVLTFIPPLIGQRTPALPEYLFFATIETVCTSVIVWQAWKWSASEPVPSSQRAVGNAELVA
jgi:hypothetical protein